MANVKKQSWVKHGTDVSRMNISAREWRDRAAQRIDTLHKLMLVINGVGVFAGEFTKREVTRLIPLAVHARDGIFVNADLFVLRTAWEKAEEEHTKQVNRTKRGLPPLLLKRKKK